MHIQDDDMEKLPAEARRRRDFYNEEVQPVLREKIKRCKEENIPIIVLAEYHRGEAESCIAIDVGVARTMGTMMKIILGIANGSIVMVNEECDWEKGRFVLQTVADPIDRTRETMNPHGGWTGRPSEHPVIQNHMETGRHLVDQEILEALRECGFCNELLPQLGESFTDWAKRCECDHCRLGRGQSKLGLSANSNCKFINGARNGLSLGSLN